MNARRRGLQPRPLKSILGLVAKVGQPGTLDVEVEPLKLAGGLSLGERSAKDPLGPWPRVRPSWRLDAPPPLV